MTRRFHDDRFLWPQALVSGDEGTFGYLMRLRPPNFVGLAAHFRREVNVQHRELLTACIHLVEAYRALHSQGIAYRDISQGNVFFDPATGEVLVCDNDNAIVEGKDAGIAGTVDFMAPELVRGDPSATPRTQTDLHSLAVLLFEMLTTQHPLKGALEYRFNCIDPGPRRSYSAQIRYSSLTLMTPATGLWKESKTTCKPPGMRFPSRYSRLFTKAFTEGLHQPERRVRETQWRDAMSTARDMIAYCQHCDRQSIFDPDRVGQATLLEM